MFFKMGLLIRVLFCASIVMIISAIFASTEMVKCSVCFDETCTSKSGWTTIDCNTTTSTCIKLDDKDGNAVIRGCQKKTLCDRFDSCYSCNNTVSNTTNTEGCNSATALTPVYIVTIITAAVVKFHF